MANCWSPFNFLLRNITVDLTHNVTDFSLLENVGIVSIIGVSAIL